MDEPNYWERISRKHITRRRLLSGAALGGAGLAAAALVGCGEGEKAPRGTATATPTVTTTPAAGEPTPGGTLRFGVSESLDWDVHKFGDFGAALHESFTHSNLLTWDFSNPAEGARNFAPKPDLAESWEVSDDATTVTLKLRQGMRWQNLPPLNGRELTADDAKFNLERLLEPDSLNGWVLGPIVGVETPDTSTVVVRFSGPSPSFLSWLGHAWFPVYAPEVLDEFGSFSGAESVIGTGPWVLEEYEPGVRAVFAKNPDYFRSQNGVTGENLPYIDRIEGIITIDRPFMLAQYSAANWDSPGNYSGYFNIFSDEIAQLEDTHPELLGDLRSWADETNNYWFGARTDQAPFSNQKVRQAVSMAVDRSAEAWTPVTATGIVPGRELTEVNALFLPFGELGEGARYYTRDLEEARKLLREGLTELGLDPDQQITVKLNTTAEIDPFIVLGSETIKAWLSEIGINAEINLQAIGDFYATTYVGDYEGMAFMYGEATWVDAAYPFFAYYHSSSPLNRDHVNDPELDPLLEEAIRETDPERKGEILSELQKLTAAKQYYWWMPSYFNFNAYAPWLKNVGPQKMWNAGDSFLEAWLTEDAPGR